MITYYHILLGFLFSLTLPILSDFVVGFLRLSSFSPSTNPISFSNSRAVKAVLSETFSKRNERSFGEFLYWSLFNAANIAAYSLTAYYYDSPSNVLSASGFLIFFITYASFILGMRFLASLFSASRINFALQLDKLLFSFLCLFLLFIGLGISLKSGGFGLGDALMVIAAQPALNLAFKSLFYCEGKRSRFEKAAEASFRISFNFGLYTFYASIAFSSIGKEHLFFGLAAGLAIEILFEIFGFETPRFEKDLSASMERFLIVALSSAVGIRVFL